MEGTLFSHYRILAKAGVGGMATVYRAEDLKHGRQVALKVLHPDLAAALGSDRFLAEIRTTATLQHPNILPLFDSGEAGGTVYYVMPFVEGESLRARLDRERQLPVDEAVRIAQLVAGALDYAHRHGIIHRDIKPENILLSEGQPLVADFGIALAVTAAGGSRLTRTGFSVGTPQYMSPEQAAAEREVDPRADIYALGAVLYEMLAGSPPYTGSTAAVITARKMTEPVPPLRTIRDTVPGALEQVVRKALARTPADRFATAHQFAEALELARTLDRLPEAQAVSSPAPVGRSALARWAPWGVTAVALLTGTALLMRSRRLAGGDAGEFRLTLSTGVLAVTNHGAAPVVAISPDGRTLAYVAGLGGYGQLYLRRFDAAAAVPVKDAAMVHAPFFSPDGQWLAFDDDSPGTDRAVLRKIRLTDNAIFKICEAPDLHGATWLRDGRIVLGGTADNGYSLSIVSAEGGIRSVVARPDSTVGEQFLVDPSPLPGQAAVLFTADQGNAEAGSISVLELASGQRSALIKGGGNAVLIGDDALVYAAEGALFAAKFDARSHRLLDTPQRVVPDVLMGLPYEPALGHFAVSSDGTLVYLAGGTQAFSGAELAWLDRTGKPTTIAIARKPQALGGGPLSVAGARWQPHGSGLVFWNYTESRNDNPAGVNGEVWFLDSKTGQARLVFEEPRYFWPVWSADGQWVIAPRAEDSVLGTALFRRRLDGRGSAERLTQPIPNHWVQPYSVSADGRFLFYQQNSVSGDPASDIYVLPLTGQHTPKAVLASEASEYNPAISPDGEWLAYVVEEKQRKPQIYLSDYPALARRWQISFEGGTAPAWSPDGRFLFFQRSGGQGNMTRMAFMPGRDPPVGQAEPFPTIPPNYAEPYGRAYDVAPDGQQLLTSSSGAVGFGRVDTTMVRQLSVVVNWGSTLKKILRH